MICGYICPLCNREVFVVFTCEECQKQICRSCINRKGGRQLCPDCYTNEVRNISDNIC